MRINMAGIQIEPIKLNWLQLLAITFALGGAWYMLLAHDKELERRATMIGPIQQVIADNKAIKVAGSDLNSNIVALNLTMRELVVEQRGSEKERTNQAKMLNELNDQVMGIRVELAEVKARL